MVSQWTISLLLLKQKASSFSILNSPMHFAVNDRPMNPFRFGNIGIVAVEFPTQKLTGASVIANTASCPQLRKIPLAND
jgi:hypothetical protein